MSFNVIPRRFAKPLISSVLAIALLIAGLSVSPANRVLASGSTITVNSLSDDQTAGTGVCLQSGTICLRNALATANSATSPTMINFSLSGTITVGSTLNIANSSSNPITIDGSGQSIAIDGGSTGSGTGVQIFIVVTGTVVTFNLLTLQHGNAAAGDGGAISSDGTLTINGGFITDNIALYASGGGIYNTGNLTVNNAIISGNSSYSSGGISNYANPSHADIVTISNTVISDNSTNNSGALSSNGTMTITNSTMSGNSAMDSAGALDNLGTLIVRNSAIISNTAAFYGGGIYNGGTVTVSNSTVSNNSAFQGGGINNYGSLTLSNSTINGNSANSSTSPYSGGGGLYTQNGNCGGCTPISNVLSTIIAGNAGTSSAGNSPDVNGPVHTLGHNLIGDGAGSTGLTNGVSGDQVGTSASPLDPKLSPLASNGATTQTLALLIGSPALNKGNCSGNTSVSPAAPAVTADQRGFTRHSPCDVGAYEGAISSIDTIGIYRGGKFYLRLHNSIGNADLTVAFTAGTKPYPIVGDWAGVGFDTVGVFDQSNGKFTLCTANITASCANSANQKSLVLGVPNDQPLSGRWSVGATNAGVGVFRPSNGLIYLKNALTTGYADYTMVLGIPGDVGLAGDWNGKGFDSPGVYRPSNSTFYLSNQVKNGSVTGDYQVAYGLGGDAPVVGDWIAQGHDGIGLFRQSNGFTYLKNALTTGYADNSFTCGIAGDIPVAGHWQAVYPPIAPGMPPPVLIAKTAIPPQPDGSISSDNPLGD